MSVANIENMTMISRHKRGKPVSASQKAMIIDCFKSTRKRMKENESAPSIVRISNIISEETGIGTKTIRNTISEYLKYGYVASPKRTKICLNTITNKLDDWTKSAIRLKVHEFFHRNELPTLNKVLLAINQDEDLPEFARTTLYRVLRKLQFKYVRQGSSAVLVERDEMVWCRRNYLRQIRRYRALGKTVYYTGETWVTADYSMKKETSDTQVNVDLSMKEETSDNMDKVVNDVLSKVLSRGQKNPCGTGNKLTVVHMGSKNGFVANGLYVIESNKSGDNQEDMTATLFEDWLKDVLPDLEENSVIVLDNAPHHSRQIEKIPTASWAKEAIAEWLTKKGIPVDCSELKVELLMKVRNLNCKPAYIVDDIIRSTGREVLRLPPYHCSLNAMELIWADIKEYVSRNNTTLNLNDVKELFIQSLAAVTPNRWKDCVQHVIDKVEEEMWRIDQLTENEAEPLIITFSDDENELDVDDELSDNA